MIAAKTSASHCAQYELEIAIEAPAAKVWRAVTSDTNAWWLPDFHMVGANSRVTLDLRAGGGLIEQLEGGGSLLWYTVQCVRPEQYTLYLVGQISPDWGGPTTSHLKLAVEEVADGCVMKVSDALQGNVDDSQVNSLYDGWNQLFTEGLKAFVESGASQS